VETWTLLQDTRRTVQDSNPVGLQVGRGIRFDVAYHMEVIMVDVDHFNHLAVVQGMRNRITDDRLLAAVDRALVVSVVQLSRSDQWVEPRRVDVVSDLFLDDPHVVALLLIQEWYAALNGACALQSLNHFVIARRIQRHHGATGGRRSENRHAIIALVIPELLFLAMLVIRAYRNRNAKDTKTRALLDAQATGTGG